MGSGGMGSGCGSRSKGLVVAHTVLVASLRYRAVVAMLRCPISSWIRRTSAPVSSKCVANACLLYRWVDKRHYVPFLIMSGDAIEL